MLKASNSGKKTVELASGEARPSRIRREPPAPAPAQKPLNAYPSEREVTTVVIGVLLFAIAIAIIILGVSDYTA